MKVKTVVSFVLLLFVVACGVGPVHTIPDTEFELHPMQYTTARHYFVKNTIGGGFQQVINSRQAFDSIFGMAAVMGKDGQPTPINFEKQSALAVAVPESDSITEIHTVSLDQNNGKVQFIYKVVSGAPAGYTTHVCTILIVDKLNPDSVNFVRIK